MRSGPGVCSRPLSAIARSSTRSATRPRWRRPSPSTTSPTAPRPMPPPPPTDRRTRAMADLAQIPTTVVGSHGKPGWWFASVKAHEAGDFGPPIHPGKLYTGVVDVAERFAEVINAELRGLVAAGADFIQIDEPARGTVTGEEMARLFNAATEGVRARLAYHVCFGNRFGRSRFERSYAPYFPGLLQARADQFVLEFAGREMAELDLWQKYGDGRELGAGVVDVKGFNQDTPEQVAARIRRVLEVCRPEKLTVNPDCGFGWSPRYMCNQKLRALAAGAQLVRRQLAGK